MSHQPTPPAPRDFTAASYDQTLAGQWDAHREAVARWRDGGRRGERPQLLDAAELEQHRATIRTVGRNVAQMERRLLASKPRGQRARGAGRPARRAGSSSSTSSADPGEDGEPPPPRLTLAARSRAVFTFACLPAAEREDVEVGR